jgi:histidinol-phosphate phosphatase family protein
MSVAAPPVFLDRDGTLIVERNYLSDPAEVRLETGVVEGLRTLKQSGHALIVLSNQSGIGRGMFKESDAHRVNARVADILRGYGIDVLAWYICPHAPEAMCTCRKPLAGMALTAASDWNLELAGSYVIGDKRADLELAEAIGATGILVTTGHGADSVGWAKDRAWPVFDSMQSAADYIAERDLQRRSTASSPVKSP